MTGEHDDREDELEFDDLNEDDAAKAWMQDAEDRMFRAIYDKAARPLRRAARKVPRRGPAGPPTAAVRSGLAPARCGTGGTTDRTPARPGPARIFSLSSEQT